MASAPDYEHRQNARVATDVQVTVRGADGTASDATMVDVSAGGAMLTPGDGRTGGERIVVSARGVEVPAIVAWVRDGRCGVSFARRLQLGEVALLSRKGRRPLVANG